MAIGALTIVIIRQRVIVFSNSEKITMAVGTLIIITLRQSINFFQMTRKTIVIVLMAFTVCLILVHGIGARALSDPRFFYPTSRRKP
jgi:ABC-type proline/glycine betaine transport system permease subunit